MAKYKCKECGKEFDEITMPHGKGDFCSLHCARKYCASKQRGKIKYLRCTGCNRWVPVPLVSRSFRVLCENCKNVNDDAKGTLFYCKRCDRPFFVKNVFFDSTEYCPDCLTIMNEKVLVADTFKGIDF